MRRKNTLSAEARWLNCSPRRSRPNPLPSAFIFGCTNISAEAMTSLKGLMTLARWDLVISRFSADLREFAIWRPTRQYRPVNRMAVGREGADSQDDTESAGEREQGRTAAESSSFPRFLDEMSQYSSHRPVGFADGAVVSPRDGTYKSHFHATPGVV
jgi:hypothetical protein